MVRVEVRVVVVEVEFCVVYVCVARVIGQSRFSPFQFDEAASAQQCTPVNLSPCPTSVHIFRIDEFLYFPVLFALSPISFPTGTRGSLCCGFSGGDGFT